MITRKRSPQQRLSRWLSTVVVAALIGSASAFGVAPAFADSAPSDEATGVVTESSTAPSPEDAVIDPATPAPDADTDADAGEAPREAPSEAEAETPGAGAADGTADEEAKVAVVPAVPVEQAAAAEAAQAVPSITATLAPHGGGTVTLTGTGFAASAPGIYLGLGKSGLPGFYQGGSGLVASETTWVSITNTTGESDAGKTARMNADGSFEFTVTVPAPNAEMAEFAIYTSKAHGQGFSDPSQNTITPIVFAEAPVPTVSVSKTSGIDPAGEFVTVRGTGFLQSPETTGTRPPLLNKFTGSYVAFGRFADEWKPSANAPATSRTAAGDTKWAVLAADMATIGGPARGAIELSADGTFETELWVTEDFEKNAGSGNYGVYSYAAGGATYAPFESYTAVSFAAPVVDTSTTLTVSNRGPVALGTSVTLTAAVAPANASGSVQFLSGGAALGTTVALNAQGKASMSTTLATAGSVVLSARFVPASGSEFSGSTSAGISVTVQAPPAVPGGSLSWGVDSGFRDYVTGPIAHGSIALSGGATSLGGAYHFGQGSASFDHSNGIGSAAYTGTVRFSGHNGELDLSFANPTVRVDSASSGSLLVTVNGSTVTLATLNLGAGARSTIDGATRFADVPATLTSEGASAFNGFYGAGRMLSPVSFTIGSASSAPAGASGTVSTASASAPTAKSIPATPPATTGIEIAPDALKRLLAGESATVTASGFQPDETGIRVIIYSTPTVLAENVTADAEGVASWTGALPVGLTGTHTLTFQGSVDRGIVLDIPTTTQPGFCPVEGAELNWGLKERFRDYVLGGIANGTIELAGGTTEIEGGFAWASGTGEFNVDTTRGLVSLPGSVRFTGHGGVLDTTIANPRLEIESADRAWLLLDITGTTQQGEVVNALGVRFAEVTLTGASAIEDGVFVVTDAAATLTEQGTESFGTYPAGEQLDPVSFRIPLPADCAVAPAALDEKPIAEEAAAEVQAPAGADLGWIGWLAGALLLLAAAATTVVILRRRAVAASGANSAE